MRTAMKQQRDQQQEGAVLGLIGMLRHLATRVETVRANRNGVTAPHGAIKNIIEKMLPSAQKKYGEMPLHNVNEMKIVQQEPWL
jgi:hypothetical protein